VKHSFRAFVSATPPALAAALAVLLAGCRGEISRSPPIHPVLDMDFQQKLKPQSRSTFTGWKDHRGMREPVTGTLARGHMPASGVPGDYYVPETAWMFQSFDQNGDGKLSRIDVRNLPFHRAHLFALADTNHDDFLEVAEVEAIRKIWTYKNADGSYVAVNALAATRETLDRGRQRFNIYCATCHGRSSRGGLVAKRWPVPVPDLSLNEDEATRTRLVGLPPGELFETMTQGKGTMPGYASQIHVEDRWAIAHYLKALQQHFN